MGKQGERRENKEKKGKEGKRREKKGKEGERREKKGKEEKRSGNGTLLFNVRECSSTGKD